MNVILCYNKEDGEQADTLYNRLQTFGFTLWLDPNDAGDDHEWKQRITQAINDRSYILFLISSNTLSKNGHFSKKLLIAERIVREFSEAKDLILLVRLDDCQLPDDEEIPIQHIDLFPSYEVGFRSILHFFITEGEKDDIYVPNSLHETGHPPGEAAPPIAVEEQGDLKPSDDSLSLPDSDVSPSFQQAHSDQVSTRTVYSTASSSHVQLEDFLGRVDRYQLVEKLGSGGYGAVFRARDTIANIDIAIKILPHLLTNNKEELDDIRRNFSLVSRLRHQNIATLLHLHEVVDTDDKADQELGLIPGHYLTVMEYVPGVTIKTYLKQQDRRRLGVKEALEICLTIAEVLDYAHSKKIVHRDIKPSNIMLTPDKEIKVLDFGLAAEIRSSMSRVSKNTTAITGTFPYMSPEQWQGKRLNGRSDQYALAVLFHELITSEVPFAGIFSANDSRLMRDTVLTQAPDRLPELSRKQNKLLHRALSKNPQDRFSSCQDFISDMLRSMPNRRALLFRQLTIGLLLVLAISIAIAMSIAKISKNYGVNAIGPVKVNVEKKIKHLNELNQGQGIAAEIKGVNQIVALAERSLKEKDSEHALTLYHKALEKSLQIELLDEQRNKARQSRLVVTKAQSNAKLVNADVHAQGLWTKAIELENSAIAEFESGDFVSAESVWKNATEIFRNAEKHAKLVRRILTAKGTHEDKLSRVNKKLLEEFGGEKWDEIKRLAKEGEQLWNEEQVKESAIVWEKASRLTSELVQSVMSDQRMDQARQQAELAQKESEKARAIAESFKAAMYANTYWTEGISLDKTAEKYYESNDFIQARKKWELAASQFKLAENHSEQMRRLLHAKSKYKSIFSKFDEKTLYELGGEKWEQTMLVVVQAEGFERDGKFNAALSKWDEASRLLSKVGDSIENARREQTLTEYLKLAEDAKAKEDWEEALDYCQKALAIDPELEKAKVLQHAVEEQLIPKLIILSVVDNQQVEGAKVIIDNVVYNESTPATVKMELDKEYEIKVELPNSSGQQRFKPFETIYAPTRPGSQTLRAVLARTEMPLLGQLWTMPGLGMKFVPIKSGFFKMGTDGGDDDEQPIHQVNITTAFWIGKYEVTQEEYRKIFGRNPSRFVAPRNPVENVSWYEAVDFCDRLTEIEQANGRLPSDYVYRLPTEAEWEYCCRAGTETEFSFGNILDWTLANFNGKYPYGPGQKGEFRNQSLPVESFKPNPWGTYNMHGNVWEWCLDRSDWESGVITDTYINGIEDPLNTTGSYRIIRGGNFRSFAGNCRSANRHVLRPASRNDGLGFRVVLGPDI